MLPERLQAVVDQTKELTAAFESAGMRLYLVGGTVRDAIAGRPGGAPISLDADLDFTTNASPELIESIVGPLVTTIWTQGKRFGTIGALYKGHKLEITTHRAEVYHPDSRKPEVVFGDKVELDLSRRDFTVNAMALDLGRLLLIDPFGGLEDLAARRLRTPLDPSVSFSDDPLRTLRAARFIAGYDLVPDPELLTAVVEFAPRLAIVSPERIRDEFDKLIVLERPEAGLWFLLNTGLAAQFIPELPALALEQDPVHRHKDVLAHTIAVVAKTRPEKILRLAALFHDVGKPATRAFGPGGVTFHHHDVVGARLTKKRMTAMRYPTHEIDDVSRLVELHLRFHTYEMGWTDSALRRYARDAGPLLERLNDLTRADCTTRNKKKAEDLSRRIDEFELRLSQLQEREALEAIRPELDGTEVMQLLSIPPGKTVGRALSFLLELRLEEGLLGHEEATRRLLEWWSSEPA